MSNKQFPNGFESWQETHSEVVQYLSTSLDYSGSMANLTRENFGHGGLYEIAEQITDEFEKLYEGMDWDGDFFDTIEEFLNKKEYEVRKSYKL